MGVGGGQVKGGGIRVREVIVRGGGEGEAESGGGGREGVRGGLRLHFPAWCVFEAPWGAMCPSKNRVVCINRSQTRYISLRGARFRCLCFFLSFVGRTTSFGSRGSCLRLFRDVCV